MIRIILMRTQGFTSIEHYSITVFRNVPQNIIFVFPKTSPDLYKRYFYAMF